MTDSLKEATRLSYTTTFESPKLRSLDNLEKHNFSQNNNNNKNNLHSYNSYCREDLSERCTHNSEMSIGINNFLRAIILFILGSILSFVLNILQMEYKSNLFPSNVLSFFQTIWWAIPVCGLAAVYIGISYPYFDHKLGQCHHNDRDWTLIIRCISVFIGFNHLCAKIQFANTSHFLIIFITFCLVFWYWFDNSKFGLIFNIINAVSVIIAAHVLRHYGIFSYNEIQFNYLQICLLCLTFSGGVTFGNLGRLLDFYDIHHSHTNINSHFHAD